MKTETTATIAILGISENKERYSYLAYERLQKHGFNNLFGVSPKEVSLPNIECTDALSKIKTPIHTLTVYVGEKRLEGLIEEILSLKPKRIILNPGTENEKLMEEAKKANIDVIQGCTLVMLQSNQF